MVAWALEALRPCLLREGRTAYLPPLLEPAAPEQEPAAQPAALQAPDSVVETVVPGAPQASASQ